MFKFIFCLFLIVNPSPLFGVSLPDEFGDLKESQWRMTAITQEQKYFVYMELTDSEIQVMAPSGNIFLGDVTWQARNAHVVQEDASLGVESRYSLDFSKNGAWFLAGSETTNNQNTDSFFYPMAGIRQGFNSPEPFENSKWELLFHTVWGFKKATYQMNSDGVEVRMDENSTLGTWEFISENELQLEYSLMGYRFNVTFQLDQPGVLATGYYEAFHILSGAGPYYGLGSGVKVQ